MELDIKSMPKFGSKLQQLLMDCFGVEENLDEFSISQDAEKLVYIVQGKKGYYIGSAEFSRSDGAVVQKREPCYIAHVLNKQQSLNERGFTTKFFRDDGAEVCGFTFVEGGR